MNWASWAQHQTSCTPSTPRSACQIDSKHPPLTFKTSTGSSSGSQVLEDKQNGRGCVHVCLRLTKERWNEFTQPRLSAVHTQTLDSALTWRSMARAWRRSPPSTSSWSAAGPRCAASPPKPYPRSPPPDTCQTSASVSVDKQLLRESDFVCTRVLKV